MKSGKHTGAALLAAITLASTITPARAEDPASGHELDPVERAEVLFTRAMELSAEGREMEACPMLEQSLRLDPAMGTRYRLAECYEKTNRREAAYRLYTEVADEARRAGMSDRESRARLRSEALSAMLARLVVWVPKDVAETPDLVVTIDGAPLDRATWTGEPLPVELGEHVLEAMAPGRRPYRRVVAVHDATIPVELSVPTLRGEHEAPPAPRPVAADLPANPGGTSAAPSATTTAALVLGLGGAGAFLAGAGLGAAGLATGGLSEPVQSTAATGVGVGVGGIVAAGVLWFVTPRAKRASGGASMALVPSFDPLGGGVSLRGRF
ncbi:tetratricopeptide repeat protein [Polyangium spumosum]|uniref:Tetratricopeptide repeat protein n=1 Tax=Polyangium spumosum TaxID=889282 RepID=A0A6N7Q254_9BACT|nr:hypothetical protein [Polyangium spumosum]MRG96695.1 hypothetical protein [Polyangium spumosum]